MRRKQRINLAISAGSVDIWSDMAQKANIISTTGNQIGHPSISGLMEQIAYGVKIGAIDMNAILTGVYKVTVAKVNEPSEGKPPIEP